MMRARFVLLLPSVLVAASCSFSRFDDLTKKAPAVELKRPKQIDTSFGASVYSATVNGKAQALVGGTPGISSAAAFALGDSDSPTLDQSVGSLCRSDATYTCFLSSSPLSLATLKLNGLDPLENCFVVGSGSVLHQDKAEERGVLVECDGADGRVAISLPVPDSYASSLDDALASGTPDVLAFASDNVNPTLIVGAADDRLAWIYPTPADDPIELVPDDGPDKSFGKSVAVVNLGKAKLFVVAAPDAGNLYLFGSTGADAPTYAGCIGGNGGLGRSIAVGKDRGPLVVADDHSVYVIDPLTLLDELDPTAGCMPLPADALSASLSCDSQGDVSGCEGSDFGAAVAVADLDGDGDSEIIVGAPRMKVRDKDEAGAVLVYDLENSDDVGVSETRFISSAEQGDWLGSSVTAVSLPDHDVLLAGAPGNQKAVLFYCSSLFPDTALGRCH